jgi:hypothetical protein
MNNMKQTAVEWLAEQMMHPQIFNPYIEQAIEMEKQQIIEAKDCWFEDERDGEQYYNDTYKKP